MPDGRRSEPTPLVAPGERVVEWYRHDASRRIVRILIPSSFVLATGAVLVSRSLFIRELTDAGALLGLLGLILVALGPLSAIVGLRRVLRAEDFLLLCTDGLFHHAGGTVERYLWADIERVEFDEGRDGIELRMRNGERHRIDKRFAGIGNPALAHRLDEVRRKATFGVLPQQRGRSS